MKWIFFFGRCMSYLFSFGYCHMSEIRKTLKWKRPIIMGCLFHSFFFSILSSAFFHSMCGSIYAWIIFRFELETTNNKNNKKPTRTMGNWASTINVQAANRMHMCTCVPPLCDTETIFTMQNTFSFHIYVLLFSATVQMNRFYAFYPHRILKME